MDYQEIQIIFKKMNKKFEEYKNIVAIFRINSINSNFLLFFICRASRIGCRSLLISSALIGMLSTRIFRNWDLVVIKHA